ncbi:MAG: alpha-glucosidase C-terminal domain-containing protein [Alphaproteobacteria bacterium]|nr:alpha-glucosidase C-terminal domain-containing protein [Alphaproteobacteria bacterium]
MSCRHLIAALLFILPLPPEITEPAATAPPEDGIVYGVVPQLFGPRGIADVTERLDEIASLGVTVLWVSPITDAPPGDFGYAVTDPFAIRRSIGTDTDLRALVQGAHARGLKVILDIATNDVSAQHPYFRDTLRNGAASAYYDFFVRDAAGGATHYFDWANLENLNYDNPAVRSYTTAASTHWLRDFGVDGFRVDAAWGPRQRTPGFWPEWQAEMRRLDPDMLLLAEASEHDPYYAAAGFDAAYDWTTELGQWAWHDAFAAAPAQHLRAALRAEGRTIPIFRFLDNNDTGARFITRYGIGKTRVADAMLLTLPGLPCLYMGDEVGAPFEPYASSGPIDWSDPQHLRGYVQQLVALRKSLPALHSREMTLVDTDRDDDVLAYMRRDELSNDSILVLLNYGTEPVEVSFPEPRQLAFLTGREVKDLLSDDRVMIEPDRPTVRLPALTARILRPLPATDGRAASVR